jgi:drug/metabolite transporter (DMT)-like permease
LWQTPGMIFYLLALLSPVAFAFGTVLQQRGTLRTAAREHEPRFLAQMIRQPAWLLGGLVTVGAWALQAGALRFGSLAVVQALQALSLVFALPMGVGLTGQRITRRSALAAGVTVAGLVVFVLLGQTRGGVTEPTATAWIIAGIAVAAGTAGLAWLGFRRYGAAAAGLLGTAAGILFALQAALTKLLVMQLGHGVLALLSDWPLYVLVASAALGFAVQQFSLKTGRLAPALAALEAATLAASVILAATVFDEDLSGGGYRFAGAIAGLCAAIAGVAALSYSRGRERRR